MQFLPSLAKPIRYVVTVGALASLACAACGRVGFEPVSNNSGDGGVADLADADVTAIADAGLQDAAPQTDATPTIAVMRLVGSTSCTSPENVVDVPAPGIGVGSVVLAQIFRRTSGGSVSAKDSRGNVYTEEATSGTAGTRVVILQASVTTALMAGDTITVTESNPASSAVVISALSNADPNAFSSQTGGAETADISIEFTATSPGVVYCAGGVRSGEVVMTDNWNELANIQDDCGGSGLLSVFSYWIPAGQDGIQSCEATVDMPSGLTQWAGVVRSYGESP